MEKIGDKTMSKKRNIELEKFDRIMEVLVSCLKQCNLLSIPAEEKYNTEGVETAVFEGFPVNKIRDALKAVQFLRDRVQPQFIINDNKYLSHYGIMQLGWNIYYIHDKEEYEMLEEVFRNYDTR